MPNLVNPWSGERKFFRGRGQGIPFKSKDKKHYKSLLKWSNNQESELIKKEDMEKIKKDHEPKFVINAIPKEDLIPKDWKSKKRKKIKYRRNGE